MSILVILLALLIVAAIGYATHPSSDDLPDSHWTNDRLWSRYPRV